MKVSRVSDWSLVIVFNFMWATQVPVIRLIGNRLGEVAVAFVPMLISTIIFLPILGLENKKRKVSFRWRWNDIKDFIIPGLIGIFLMQYLYTVGSRMTLAANAGIITLTIPVIVTIFASVFLNEKLNIVRILSFALAIIGVLLTSTSDISGSDFKQGEYFAGNLVFFMACACCGFYNAWCKKLIGKNYTELEILVYSSIIGSIAAIPLLIWMEPFSITGFINSGKDALLGILELSVIVYGVSMLLYFYVLHRMDVTQAILGNYLLPFFIALLGVWLLKESVTTMMLVGGFIILASTLMVSVYEKTIMEFFYRDKIKEPIKNK
ncbi:MAG: DMT family transporter [Chitinophagaceae bacterium]|nr:DMT family transporter [Chitinophagaceae bacterium]